MKNIVLITTAVLLTACGKHYTKMNLADGRPAYRVECGGMRGAKPANCAYTAGKVCGTDGYDVIETYASWANHTIIIVCKDQNRTGSAL